MPTSSVPPLELTARTLDILEAGHFAAGTTLPDTDLEQLEFFNGALAELNRLTLKKVPEFISCDIETIGLSACSSIIEVGVCLYKNGKYKTVSHFMQPDMNRSDIETIEWWNKQPNKQETMARARSSDIDRLQELWPRILGDLGLTVNQTKSIQWWFRGPQFDEAMLRRQGPELWGMRKVRCQRTLEALAIDLGYKPPSPLPAKVPGQKHDAGFDAENQARAIVEHLTWLGNLDLNKCEAKDL